MGMMNAWMLLWIGMLNVSQPQTFWVAAASRSEIHVQILSGAADVQIEGPFFMRHLPLFQVHLQGHGTVELQVPNPFVVHPGKYFSAEFAQLYRLLVVNHVEVIPPSSSPRGDPRTQGARVLVITPSSFVDSLGRWLEWKNLRGVSTVVATLEETGTSFSSIHAFIQNAYNTWDVPPEYVVLVGDESWIPPVIVYDSLGCGGYFPIDNPYAQLDGEDYLADVMLGRISVRNLNELRRVLHKILVYERTPDTTSPWLTQAVLFSGDIFERDSMYSMAKDSTRMVLETLGFTQIDAFYLTDSGPMYSSSHVLNALAEGRGFLNYRGNAFGELFPPWDTVDASHALTGQHFPIVVIPTCDMGNFTLTNQDYGEVWLTTYQPEQGLGGAVAYVSTSGCVFGMEGDPYFHTYRRNALDVGFFRGLLDLPSPSLGYLLEAGRMHLLSLFPTPEFWAQYHYEEFLILGDPELRPWKHTPRPVEVTYPSHSSSGTFPVTVTRQGVPVSNAYVTFFNNGQFVQDTTDETGSAVLSVPTHGIYTVTVTGDGIYPYQGLAFFGPDSIPEIVVLQEEIVDRIEGNGNGTPNPAETLHVIVQLANLGGEPANDVTLTLHMLSPYLSPVDTLSIIPEVQPGEVILDSSLSFYLLPEIPTNNPQQLLLTITQGQQTFVDTLTIIPQDFRLEISGNFFLSSSNPEDSIPMPGDTGPLVLGFWNREPFPLQAVTMNLRVYRPGISVLDSITQIQTVSPGEITWNIDDPFEISVDPLVLEGTWVACTVTVHFPDGYTLPLGFQMMVGNVDYIVLPVAPESPSPPVLDSILSDLGYRGQILNDLSLFPWVYRNTEAVFLCAGVSSYNQEISKGLFADALERALRRGAMFYLEGDHILFQKDTIPFLSMFPLRYENWVTVETLDSLKTSSWSPCPGLTFSYDTTGISSYTKVLADGSGGIVAMFVYVHQSGGSTGSFPAAYTVNLDSVHGYVTPYEFGRLIEQTPQGKALFLDSLMHYFGVQPAVEEQSMRKPLLQIKVFPNPASQRLVLQIPTPYRLTLYDLAGRQRLVVKGRGSTSPQVIPLHLPSGTYFLRIESQGRTVLRKQVIFH